MKKLFKEIFKGTYLDKDTGSGILTLIFLAPNIFASIIIGSLVAIFLGFILLVIGLILKTININIFSYQIGNFYKIFSVIIVLCVCTIGGAWQGAKNLKNYSRFSLGIPIDDIENIIDNMPHDKATKLKDKIYSSITKVISDEFSKNY